MGNKSLTITGLVAMLIGFAFQNAGFDVEATKIDDFLMVFSQLIGMVGVYWGRYRQGDITLFGTKK